MIRNTRIFVALIVVLLTAWGCGKRVKTQAPAPAPQVAQQTSSPATAAPAQVPAQPQESPEMRRLRELTQGAQPSAPAAPAPAANQQPVAQAAPAAEPSIVVATPVAPQQPAPQVSQTPVSPQETEVHPAQQGIPLAQQEQVRVWKNSGGKVHMSVVGIPIYPPAPKNPPRLSDAEIMVAGQEIFMTPVGNSFLGVFKTAKDRAEQEDAIFRYASNEIKTKLEEMHRQQPANEPAVDPDNYPPARDFKTAMENRVYKDQGFADFEGWGVSPFGPEAQSWQDLRDRFESFIEAMIQRTDYPLDVKTEWVETLRNVLEDGPDGKFSKEVNFQDWSYWHWTTGLMASNAIVTDPNTGARRRRGINIHYTGGPAKGLAIYLKKSGMWIIHAYKCRGNPVVPILGPALFGVDKVTEAPKAPPAQCQCNIVTADTAAGQISNRVEITLKETLHLRAHVTGENEQIEIKSERWTVNGIEEKGNSRDFVFDPSRENFHTGTFEVVFELTDQFGRVTRCPFKVMVKEVPPPPPPVISRVPPPVVPPTKVEKRRRIWPYVLAAGLIGGGIAAAILAGGHDSKPSIENPGVPPDPRRMMSVQNSIKFGISLGNPRR